MESAAPQSDLLNELDARHNDLLSQLEALEKRVETAIGEIQAASMTPPDSSNPPSSPEAP